MTHEPQHIRTGTIKRNSRRPGPAGGRVEEASPVEPAAGSPAVQPGIGDAGDDGDVVGGGDGQGGPQSGQTTDADTVSHFGIDGDFGCTRPPGLGGFWSTLELHDTGEDLADRAGGHSAEGPGEIPGPGRCEVQAGSEVSRAIAEVLRQGRSERDPEETDLFDSGDVSETDRGVEPAA